jgi:hypothetical protein
VRKATLIKQPPYFESGEDKREHLAKLEGLHRLIQTRLLRRNLVLHQFDLLAAPAPEGAAAAGF